jgi:hypothetical protein
MATNYLDILNAILSESDEMKEWFITLEANGGRIAWIPGPGGISLTKGIGSCTGDLLEHSSILGPFFQVSYLPVSLTLKADQRFSRVSDKVDSEIRSVKT